jgi:hypothetical protein
MPVIEEYGQMESCDSEEDFYGLNTKKMKKRMTLKLGEGYSTDAHRTK